MMDVTNGADSRYQASNIRLDLQSDDTDEAMNNNNNNTVATGKASRRQAKNVGGWISPDFAKDIDRSWLEGHVPPENNKQSFHLSNYVPQIGDTVLYYISGHRAYLDRYPDILAQKNRGKKTRIPLWERANQLREEFQSSTSKPSDNNPWWNDEWLDGMQNDNLGDYPILCRVERTHAEFPPDPYSKVVESDKQSDGTIVRFKKPKKFMKTEGKVSMRLAVTLRPLSHVIAPSINDGFMSQKIDLSLPPIFSVVTFPCELDPFLVPFLWAYVRAHSVSLNQKLSFCNDETNIARVDAFVSLSGRDTMRIDDRQDSFHQLLSTGCTELEKALVTQDLDIPIRETRILLDFWNRQFPKVALENCVDNSPENLSEHFRYLLRSTFPLWQNIVIRKRTYDIDKPRVSAWSLAPIGQARDLNNTHSNRLDEPLRLKIERAMVGIMSSDTEAKELFFDPVTEELAPCYNCAVPLGMSFSTVMQRLRVHIGYNSCYYRSVEAIVADISWIQECCLLYNSPESEVVDIAANVIDNTKEILTQVIRDHYKYMKSARTKDCERLVVMLQPRQWLQNFGRKFGNGFINRDWLEEKLPSASTTVDPIAQHFQIHENEVPFQVGDKIMYSRSLHNRFIIGHCSSLESDQCHIPSTEYAVGSNASDSIDNWEQGLVVSTHAVFPKILTRDEKDSFESSAILQCLGVKFGNNSCPSVLFWRPCLIKTSSSDSRAPCPGCRLTSSFVKLALGERLPTEYITETSNQMQSMIRCIDKLKHRSLNYIDPDKIDPALAQSTTKQGAKGVTTKFGKSSLPSYEKLLCKTVTEHLENEQLHHGTRGTTLKPKGDDDAIAALTHAGFLPRWIIAARGGTADEDLFRKLDMILPIPKLSLEYISLKIKIGFYRHTLAIENDVIEAYLSVVYSHLFEAATRKKAAISVRRQSQLAFNENLENLDLSAEEQAYQSLLKRIRSLYGTALVAVMDTTRFQHVFRLLKSPPPKRREPDSEVHKHNAARHTLEQFVMVLRRENSNITNSVEQSDKLPRVTLKITCPKFVTDHLIARQGNKNIRINVICRGQDFSNVSLLPKCARTSNESLPSISFEPEDYESNKELARFLFSRPGRSEPCARCQVYNRTMITCRVVRKHTNLDCNWSTMVSGGIDFIDDLIKMLDPDTLHGVQENADDTSAQNEEAQREKSQPALTAAEGAEVNDLDPTELFQLATATLAQANDLAEAAKTYSECPLRLSKNFIENSFPIDKSDGHFLYCVLCGLSGDLLCCDGCPNVVHAKCIALVNLPEGDWFCEKCTAKKFGRDVSHVANPNESKFLSICSYDEYGSVTFDEAKLDAVMSQLEHLRRSRPTQKTKELIVEDTNNTETNTDSVTKNSGNSDVAREKGIVSNSDDAIGGSNDVKTDASRPKRKEVSGESKEGRVDALFPTRKEANGGRKDVRIATTFTRSKVVKTATSTNSKNKNVGATSTSATERREIEVSNSKSKKSIIVQPIVSERSIRARRDRTPSSIITTPSHYKDSQLLRPSIVKRRRIERAAV